MMQVGPRRSIRATMSRIVLVLTARWFAHFCSTRSAATATRRVTRPSSAQKLQPRTLALLSASVSWNCRLVPLTWMASAVPRFTQDAGAATALPSSLRRTPSYQRRSREHSMLSSLTPTRKWRWRWSRRCRKTSLPSAMRLSR